MAREISANQAKDPTANAKDANTPKCTLGNRTKISSDSTKKTQASRLHLNRLARSTVAPKAELMPKEPYQGLSDVPK